MMKPICVKCQRFYRPKCNGIKFIETMPIVDNAKPGAFEPQNWRPYKLWQGDLWHCFGCGHELIAGVASKPLAEHFEPNFKGMCEINHAKLIINDC